MNVKDMEGSGCDVIGDIVSEKSVMTMDFKADI
jgi:hypothetical protein